MIFSNQIITTARKTVFSFSRRPEKMIFPKKLRWNMIFLVLSGKTMFLFPENMIWHLRRTMKDDISQKKIHGNMTFSSNFLKRRSFQKGPRRDMIFLVLSGKMVFFPQKHILSLGRKWEMTFLKKYMEIWYFLCTRTGVTNVVSRPSAKKKSKMVLSRKNTPKGDWRSRLTS